MSFSILEVREQVLSDNDAIAAETRRRLGSTLLVNLMGSPGAGKTSVLLRLIALLKEEYRIGVMEADVDADVDARAVEAAGARVIQLHTGGLCHMDAEMTRQGLEALTKPPLLPAVQGDRRASGGGGVPLDMIFLENVGNLVCPAEFDVGADLRMMLLSIPEGDDKPLKYPLMFQVSDVLLINKLDAAPIFDFDYEVACQRARALNPRLQIFPVSAKTGEGFAPVADLLRERIGEKRSGSSTSAEKGGFEP